MKCSKKCCTCNAGGPRWGIGSYTAAWNLGVDGYGPLRSPWTAWDILAEAKRLGCTLIQLCENARLQDMDSAELSDFKVHADQSGIAIETGLRGIHPDVLMEHISIARALGARRVRTLVDGIDSHPDIATAVRYLEQALPHFVENGMELMLENHDLRPAAELREIIERIDSPHLGACLDTVNSLGILETQEQVLETLLPYAKCLHLKDFVIRRVRHGMGFAVEGAPVGEGMLGFESLLSAVLRHKSDASIVIELWTPDQGDVEKTAQLEREWIRKSAESVACALRKSPIVFG